MVTKPPSLRLELHQEAPQTTGMCPTCNRPRAWHFTDGVYDQSFCSSPTPAGLEPPSAYEDPKFLDKMAELLAIGCDPMSVLDVVYRQGKLDGMNRMAKVGQK